LRTPETEFHLEEALRKLIRTIDSPNLEISLDVSGDENPYSRSTRIALYRAAQEGLTNIQKHAQARHAFLRVTFDENMARLVLRDDGIGFEADAVQGNGSPGHVGFGLRGIRERLEMLRGTLQVQSSPRQGSVLIAEAPRTVEYLETKERVNP
jgi:signal transduction histidine kinase